MIVLGHRQTGRVVGVDLYPRVCSGRVLRQRCIGLTIVQPEPFGHRAIELEQELLLDPSRVVTDQLELSRK